MDTESTEGFTWRRKVDSGWVCGGPIVLDCGCVPPVRAALGLLALTESAAPPRPSAARL